MGFSDQWHRIARPEKMAGSSLGLPVAWVPNREAIGAVQFCVIRQTLTLLGCWVLGLGSLPSAATGDAPAPPEKFNATYEGEVLPTLKSYCFECHSAPEEQGDLDFVRFATFRDVQASTQVWQKIAEQLKSGEMPPADAKQPDAVERQQLLDWVENFLHAEAVANAGDPGPVILRRLNNAEYTFTIQDLTQVGLNPAREFPGDSAAGEGFTNVGNAMSMSTALLDKYFDAGKQIASHAVLLPNGFRFSTHTTSRDWTDEAVARMRAYYGQFSETIETPKGRGGQLPWAKYLSATISARDSLLADGTSIEAVAKSQGLSAKYLSILWSALTSTDPSLLLDQLRAHWRTAKIEDVPGLVEEINVWQKGLWVFNPVGLLGRKGSRSQWQEPVTPVLAQCELRLAVPELKGDDDVKETVISLVVGDCSDGNGHDVVIWQQPRLVADKQPDIFVRDLEEFSGIDPKLFGRHPDGTEIDSKSLCVHAPAVITLRLPAALAAGRTLATVATLAPEADPESSVQPDLVFGEVAVPSQLMASVATVKLGPVNIGADERTVSYARPILALHQGAAHLRYVVAMDDHRRVFPPAVCYTQIVPVDEPLTLNLHYREDEQLKRLCLDDAQSAQIDTLWNELLYISADALRQEDVLDSLLETLIKHPQEGILNDAVEPMRKRAVAFRKQLVESESQHLEALLDFAARAYRRPLEDEDSKELVGLYHRLRSEEFTHDDAFRLTLARVFVASPFLYRFEAVPEGANSAAVSSWELANRLSYFLWSSLPDEELRNAAGNGSLLRPEVLELQTRRMLKDSRVRRLATEFACQWLHVHDFPVTEVKSEQLFPEFAPLRDDMYEETVQFLADLFRSDRRLLDLFVSNHTFLNERMAAFYGIPDVTGDAWQRIEGIQRFGRGGILGMATTLAKNSGASRTSPILRGNWVNEALLGDRLPRPPKDVPQLGDTPPEGLTERQLIERHSSDPACAKCHLRVDPLGFALEGFDAIGRRRERDRAGLPIDTKTTLPDGREIDGLDGLKDYLLGQRRDALTRQFCRKLLGYALGRETRLSDWPLLDEMQRDMASDDARVSQAVVDIVNSRQFREIRGRQSPLAELP